MDIDGGRAKHLRSSSKSQPLATSTASPTQSKSATSSLASSPQNRKQPGTTSNQAVLRRGRSASGQPFLTDESFDASSGSSLSSGDVGSAPATPATTFSTATAASSTTRSSHKRGRASAAPLTPSRSDSNLTEKGKGRASAPSASQRKPTSAQKRDATASASVSSPHETRAATRKRALSASPEDTASSGFVAGNKRRKTEPLAHIPLTTPYSLRTRRASAASSLNTSVSTSSVTMTGSETTSPPSAKGKTPTKGSRNTRNSLSTGTLTANKTGDQYECTDDPDDDAELSALAPQSDEGDWDDIDDQGASGHSKRKPNNGFSLKDGSDKLPDEQHDEEDEDNDFIDEEDEEDDFDEAEDDADDPYGDGPTDGGASMFGLNFRAMAGYMSGLSGRFRSLLTSLRDATDPSVQLVALQDLSELLSVSTEDTLAGYFPTDSFVKELVHIMGGPKPERPDVTSNKSAKQQQEDDDMAAAIAAAAAADDEGNGESMLLACRCLANLIEAMPYAAHSVVTNGAITVLNAKLMEITFIDLAEQVLQTLEKISQDYPGAIVKEGGLSAILQYLDFFNIHIQRTAMTAAANCCRKLTAESLSMVKDVIPIIQNVLAYSDQRLVESACKCIVRIVESYRHNPELLEQLLSDQLLAALNNLLLPASSSSASTTSLGANTYTDVLKALGSVCRSSPKLAVSLLENNIVETLYHLLTGSPAPVEGVNVKGEDEGATVHAMELEKDGTGPASGADTAAVAVVPDSGGSVAVADMAVLQNLAQRPKEQVQEALSLVGELLPPLPRDGVFDSRAYTERAYLKRKAKANRPSSNNRLGRPSSGKEATSRKAESENAEANLLSSPLGVGKDEAVSRPTPARRSTRPRSDKETARETAQMRRIEMLRSRKSLVKRFTHLVLPTLIEVYAASVALHVRTKAINGILKIVSFVNAEPLAEVLDNVPLASFVAAILSSRDNPNLVNGALQVVELLTDKLPSVYTSLLRREGVMWEIEDIASQNPSSSASTDVTDSVGKSKAGDLSVQPISLPGGDNALVGVGASRSDNFASVNAPTSLARFLAATSVDKSLHVETLGNPTPTGSLNAQILAESTDATIWRARVLRDKFQAETSKSEGAQHAVQALDHIKVLVKKIEDAASSGEQHEALEAIESLALLFSRSHDSISSFELLRSGLVEALYAFATNDQGGIHLAQRRKMLMEALMKLDAESDQNAASVLVRRLQESLSRLENVEITTALSAGSDDTRRSPTAMLGRQLRLRLQAEDSTDIPRSCNNIVVTIHAVATFQSLSDYLRPKLVSSAGSGNLGSGSTASASSRLSSVLAAFAAATGSSGFPELGAASASDVTSQAAIPDQKKSEGEDKSSKSSQEQQEASTSDKDSGSTVGDQASDSRKSTTGKADAQSHDEDARALAQQLFGGGEGDTSEDRDADEALARQIMDGLLHGEDMDEDGFSDEDFDEEILQDEIAAGDEVGMSSTGSAAAAAADKTINLDVEKDGDKVVAKTPDGTRVATPSQGASTPTPKTNETPSASASPSKAPASYSSALQKKPADWHLEFSMGSEKLTLDTTIYGAVHQFETAAQNAASSASGSTSKYIWTNVYTVKYKKVSGPVPSNATRSTPEPSSQGSVAVVLPASVREDAPYAKLLQLLAVVHKLNSEWRESNKASGAHDVDTIGKPMALSEASFVNNKLTAKLNRQLEEPMIVASSCLPDWSTDLPRYFPFLFPFEARFAFLQSTSFGYARLITRWHALHSRNQEAGSSSSSRLDDSFGFLGRVQRQKVRISRSNILASAFKVFELYGSNSSVLEVEYFEEVGTGLGPTLEFYSLVSKEFARKDVKLWRSSGDTPGVYVQSPQGLFPAPMVDESKVKSLSAKEQEEHKKRLQAFKIMGQFVAKALLDSRIIDCNFSPLFMLAVLNEHVPHTLAMLAGVDATLARSLASMQKMGADEVDSLALDFTVPGYESIELHVGGKDTAVTSQNVDQYIDEVLEVTLDRGIRGAVRSFRQGFNLIFPISAMSSFTADELVMLFGNTEEDWSESTLISSIKPDHGFNSESPTFRDLVTIMASFDRSERREFLQWLTGSPKLPIGGFSGLHPQLTIVKRPHEAPLTPDDYLPSVMTCVNYLKMPNYSSRDRMRERLQTAMQEGSTSFHLS